MSNLDISAKASAALPDALCKMWQVQPVMTISLFIANTLVLIYSFRVSHGGCIVMGLLFSDVNKVFHHNVGYSFEPPFN